MAYVVFVRHGQGRNNVERVLAGRTPGFGLTPKGKEQAGEAARFLSEMGIAAVYSSPIERALQTARIICKECSLEPSVLEELTELDMGKFTGMNYDDVFPKYGNVFTRFYAGDQKVSDMGVEPFEGVRERVRRAVDRAVSENPGRNVALVTHMDPVKAMLSEVISPSPQTLFETIIANASINAFKHDGGRYYLSAVNVMGPGRFDGAW